MMPLDRIGIGDHARSLISAPGDIFNAQVLLSLTQTLTGFMTTTTLVLGAHDLPAGRNAPLPPQPRPP